MLKNDVKKKKSSIKKQKPTNKKNWTKRKFRCALHIFFCSTILLMSHYLHQTKLEMRRCFQQYTDLTQHVTDAGSILFNNRRPKSISFGSQRLIKKQLFLSKPLNLSNGSLTRRIQHNFSFIGLILKLSPHSCRKGGHSLCIYCCSQSFWNPRSSPTYKKGNIKHQSKILP